MGGIRGSVSAPMERDELLATRLATLRGIHLQNSIGLSMRDGEDLGAALSELGYGCDYEPALSYSGVLGDYVVVPPEGSRDGKYIDIVRFTGGVIVNSEYELPRHPSDRREKLSYISLGVLHKLLDNKLSGKNT